MTDRMDAEALRAMVGDLRQYHFDKEADVMEALAAEVLELRADHETAVRQVELAAEQMKGLVAELAAEKALADRLSEIMDKPNQSRAGMYHYRWLRVDEAVTAHRKARGL